MKFRYNKMGAVSSFLVFGYVLTSLTLSGIPGWSRVASLFCLSLLIYVIVNLTQTRQTIPSWYRLPLSFLILCGVMTIVAGPLALDVFITTLVSWVGALAIATLSCNNSTVNHVVISAMVVSSFINAIAVLVGFDSYSVYATYTVSEAILNTRASGLVGNANLLVVQAFLPLFALSIWKDTHSKLLWVLGGFGAIVALIESGSRKGVFLAILLIGVVALRSNLLVRNSMIVVVSFLLCLVAVFSAGILSIDSDWLRSVVAIDRAFYVFEGEDQSFAERYEFMEKGARAFMEQPIFGYGMDMFRHVSESGRYSHNNYVELAISGGTLLLVVYYSIYLLAAFNTWRLKNKAVDSVRERWVLLFVLLLLDVSMVSFNVRIYPILLCLLITKVPVHCLRKC